MESICLSRYGNGVHDMVRHIMTVGEVANYLGVVPGTVYRRARRGEIPAVKIGKVWRFPREALDQWLNHTALNSVKKSLTVRAHVSK